jgi:hypothetical protein
VARSVSVTTPALWARREPLLLLCDRVRAGSAKRSHCPDSLFCSERQTIDELVGRKDGRCLLNRPNKSVSGRSEVAAGIHSNDKDSERVANGGARVSDLARVQKPSLGTCDGFRVRRTTAPDGDANDRHGRDQGERVNEFHESTNLTEVLTPPACCSKLGASARRRRCHEAFD